jgi:hypothetical protein
VKKTPGRSLSPDEDPEGETFIASPRPPTVSEPKPLSITALDKPERTAEDPPLPVEAEPLFSPPRRLARLSWLVLGLGAGAIGLYLGNSSSSEPVPSVTAKVAPAVPPPLPEQPLPSASPVTPVARVQDSEASPNAESYGTLVVKATPWATLYIDGKKHGEIDGTRRRIPLPAGQHLVVFQHPSRSFSAVVTIERDHDTLREFNVTR